MKQRFITTIAMFTIIITFFVSNAYGGFSGHNTKGDYGLQSGTQPAPGFYLLAPMYTNYQGETIRNSSGDSVHLDPDERGSFDMNAYVFGLIWVSEFKVLGGNYSFQVFPAFLDNTMEVPIIALSESIDTSFTDLYFQPINIGWHTDRADFSAGLGIYAPTGEYDDGGDENAGLGMWSFELFAGATAYLDDAKSWHLATTVFYETHTEKEDSDIKVGDILTLEGGFGKSFLGGAASAGLAYYAQWKLSDDDLGNDIVLPEGRDIGKHSVYGVGPELTIPIATRKMLYGFINLRYLWEFDAQSTIEGETLVLTVTFPIPSLPLE